MDVYERLTIDPQRLGESTIEWHRPRAFGAEQRPLIWAGKGVRGALRATEELAELAELLEAPVILSGDAAGGIPDTHPLATGQLTLYDPRRCRRAGRRGRPDLAVGERGGTGHADGHLRVGQGAGGWHLAGQRGRSGRTGACGRGSGGRHPRSGWTSCSKPSATSSGPSMRRCAIASSEAKGCGATSSSRSCGTRGDVRRCTTAWRWTR